MQISELSRNNAIALGKEVNLLQTIEECGELIKAICKYNRTIGRGQKTEITFEQTYDNLIEEVADLSICLEQLIYLHDIENDVAKAREKALKKVAERYEEASE